MSPDLAHRVEQALRDAEAWTGKYCADNDAQNEPGHPVYGARQALSRIANVRADFITYVRRSAS